MLFMVKRIVVISIVIFLLGTFGCVGQSTYEKKTEEVRDLSRDLTEMQRRNTDLVQENEGLRADVSGLRLKIDELEATKNRLEQTIASGGQKPYQFVLELEKEKGRLREDLQKLLRTQDDKVRTVSRIYESFLERMKDEIAEGQVRISELRGTVTVAILDTALFDGTRTELSPQGNLLLRKISDLLKDVKDATVTVESNYGVPSVLPDTFSRKQGPWSIPSLRTIVVGNSLVQSGLDSTTLSTVTRGEFGLAAKAGSLADNDKSHRIDISIAFKE
jgi:chemotaxis protein MotB